ncbi:hypothetical protein P280DRAFT_61005 [Massarina eburnea CBS 473.64]|uniref:Heme peroxidase n=1 Tax=Massarina eburnea CBS 473.64 TaxID=1395130 RepID=A0A6A6RZL7_9PLEO|nr:hypothetical protein P280DRAFT_61005 [Massarina eburnea CBS 473.64]
MSSSTSAYVNHVDTRTPAPPQRPHDVSELDKVEKAVKKSLRSLTGVLGASLAPATDDTGDGSRLSPEEKNALYARIEGDLSDLTHTRVSDVRSLIKIQAGKIAGQPQDDKDYLMEGMIRVAANLPDDSRNRKTLTDQFVTQLWTDLKHPPLSYLGEKYQYRSADGSFNSLMHPQLGAAGTPYARTVKPVLMQTPALPDAGVVFDSVMTRKHTNPHPTQISSMLFYLASIIIHDCFRTDHRDYANSLTSSYLDLSPLYGSNQNEQDQIRTFVDGRLKPDCFSEARLLFFPPGVGCLLIMFNRFHNHVVENLALINEGGRFNKPVPPTDNKGKPNAEEYKAKLKKYDNDLFQTGRLITCGLYVNIILLDYVRTILNLNRTDSNWQLNPREEIKDLPMGVGNQVSAEFNLVYRWHSTISERDEMWTQDMFDKLFGKGHDAKSIDGRELLMKLSEFAKQSPADPSKRTFADLKRNEDGTLPDQPLVDILTSSIKDCANSFGPNRVPAVMRAIEVLGIEQSRAWNLGTLNEFRKYFNLKPHRTFEDITSDAYVADQLKHLYDHPDKVEIYPGIVVEDAKKPMDPGSGLTPSYTISRAVLSDAVALVRGDRFYTLDYNPRTLTNWGYRTADSDIHVDNGCVFYKLFLNAFPRHFKQNSVYVHYPLTVPDAMEEALKDLGKDHLYDFSKPVYAPPPREVRDYKTTAEILKSVDIFKADGTQNVLESLAKEFKLPNSTSKDNISTSTLSKALYVDNWENQVRSFYTRTTHELLAKKGCKIADFHQIDIIRDVGNLVPVHFASELFMLPLKTDERPRGIFTETELYTLLSSVSVLSSGVVNVEPELRVSLQVKTHTPLKTLGKVIESNAKALKKSGIMSSLMNLVIPDHIDNPKPTELKSYGVKLVKRLLDSGIEPETLAWKHIIGDAGTLVSTQGALFARILDFFLAGAGTAHWPSIVAMAKSDTKETWDSLTRYVLEAVRLNGDMGAMRTAVKDTTISDSGESIPVKAGEKIFLDLRCAAYSSTPFTNPETFDIGRPLEAYAVIEGEPYLGPVNRVALTAMLKVVAGLKGLRTAKGAQGKLNKVVAGRVGDVGGDRKTGYHKYLTEMWDGYWAFPCALKVNWDDGSS